MSRTETAERPAASSIPAHVAPNQATLEKPRHYYSPLRYASLPPPVLPERAVRCVAEKKCGYAIEKEVRAIQHLSGECFSALSLVLPDSLRSKYSNRYQAAVGLALVSSGDWTSAARDERCAVKIDAAAALVAITELGSFSQDAPPDLALLAQVVRKEVADRGQVHNLQEQSSLLKAVCAVVQVLIKECGQTRRGEMLLTELGAFVGAHLRTNADCSEIRNAEGVADKPEKMLPLFLTEYQRRASVLALSALPNDMCHATSGMVRSMYAAKQFGAAEGAMELLSRIKGSALGESRPEPSDASLIQRAVTAHLKGAFALLVDYERDGYRMLWRAHQRLNSGSAPAVRIDDINPAFRTELRDPVLPADPARLTSKYGYNLGPLFIQPRVGEGGRTIMVYKLKTMTSLKRTNEDSGAVDFTTGKRDQSHNFTRLGAFLRKSHIDELPNLLNFIRGELSLIGMRPLVPAEYGALPEKLRDAYASNKPSVFPVVYAFEGSPTPDDPKCDQQRLDFLQKFYDELAERPIVTRLKYGLVIAKRIFWDKKRGV